MKYKVYNNNVFDVGIRFENEANREIKIPRNGFALLSEEDVLYTDAVSTLFEEGIIYVEEQDLNEKMGYVEKNPNSLSEEEIKEILAKSAAQLKKALEKIDAQHAKDKIIQIARESDLTPSKLKLVGEVFGVDILEDLGKNVV